MAKLKAKEKLNIVNIVSRSVEGNVGVSKWEDNDCRTIAFLVPRSKIYDIKFTSPGLRYNSIYFLFGYEEHNGKKIEKVYVGQATEGTDKKAAIRRLIQHDKAYDEIYHDYWDMAVVVTNEFTKWTVADLYALEHAFCNIIDKDILWNKDNPNSGGADYEQYEAKIHDIKRLITAIGYNLFKDGDTNEQIQVKEELDIKKLEQKVVEDLHNGMSRIPEIVTPLKVVKQMCDMIPEELWNDETVFLDPACKGGEYLREIYDRLMRHPILVDKFGSEIERSNHILGKQIYGIALSQTSLDRTRRALLGYDNNIKMIVEYLPLLKGKIELTKKDGTKKTIKDKLDEEFGKEMKIDVVIGNPPYQESTGGGVNGGKALYHQFIDMAEEIQSNNIIMVVPSRWMSDIPNGIGNKWLDKMRTRDDILRLIDFKCSEDVFKGVKIAGGVCYFLINRSYKGDCEITYIDANGAYNRKDSLCYDGIIVRDVRIRKLIDKVKKIEGSKYNINNSLYKILGTNRQFSPNDTYFSTNWDGFSILQDEYHYIKYYASDKTTGGIDAFVSEDDLAPSTLWLVKKFKCLMPLTGPTNGKVINLPFIVGRNTCCSRTYAPIYGDEVDNEFKASNLIKYFRTKFLRYLVCAIKTTQHATRNVYKFVPMQDFTENSDINWSLSVSEIDKQLYKKYNLTQEEINYIEKTIKPME